jgi:hypothetical protein
MGNNFKHVLTGKLQHKNFSEEIRILSEAVAGINMSTYVIKNKNNVIFQAVPGMPYQREQGRLGFVNGDKSRPVLVGSSKRPNAKNASPTISTSVSVSSDPGFPVADITPDVEWDIKLVIESTPGCTGSKTVSEAVKAF